MAATNVTYSNGAKHLGIQYAVGSDGKMYMQYPGSNNWTIYDTLNAAKGSATGKVIENLINGSGYTYAGNGRFTAILPETKTVDAVIGATKPAEKSTAVASSLPKVTNVQSIPVRLDILDLLAPAGLNNALRIAALSSQKGSNSNLPYNTFKNANLASLTSRRNWVGEHADYLKSKGWTDKEIEGYKGLNLTDAQRAALNLKLASHLGGYNAWNSARVSAAQPRVTNEEKFVKEGYTSGRQWQDAELQNMEGSSALYLNPEDYTRWMALLTGKKPAGYVVPTPPRTDIYNEATAVAPFAQVNSVIAAPAQLELGSGPITEEEYFKMHPFNNTKNFIKIGSTPHIHLKEYYGIKKTGGKINYQKIFK